MAVAAVPSDPTRGERNHNPGNIVRDGTHWLGLQPATEDETRFCIFDSDLHGIRALCRVLLNYQRLDHLNTLDAIVNRYAPSTENNTEAYIADLEQRTGIAREAPLNLSHADELRNVATAIIQHENGRCLYSADLIAQAATMAIGRPMTGAST